MSTTVSISRTAPGPRGKFIFGSLHEFRNDPLNFYLKMQRTYGDLIRLRSITPFHWYLVTHPELIEHVLYKNQQNYPKGPLFESRVSVLVGQGLLTSEGEFWRRQRRLAQPAFHRQRLAAMAKVMVDAAQVLVTEWQEVARTNRTFDALHEMMRLTLKIAGLTLCSTDVSGDASRVAEALTVTLDHMNYRFTHPFSLPEQVPLPRNKRFFQAKKQLDDVVYGVIENRRRAQASGASAPDDLLSMLLHARDEETGESMSDEQLRDEVITLLLAGHETTAVNLAWTWYALATHPEVEAQLHDELTRVLSDRVPTAEDLPQLPYTRMVVEESLRLYPPAWSIMRTATAADEIRGYRIEPGSVLDLCQFVVHRHPEFWSEPERFNPERFTPAAVAARPRGVYFPFGAGARVCIGNNFALMETQLILATIAQRYRLKLQPNQVIEPEPSFTLRPRNGVMMTLVERQ